MDQLTPAENDLILTELANKTDPTEAEIAAARALTQHWTAKAEQAVRAFVNKEADARYRAGPSRPRPESPPAQMSVV